MSFSAARTTVRRPARFQGVGLHGGQPVTATVAPATAGSGIVFHRTDIGGAAGIVPARYDLVADTRLCTRLTNAAGTSVGTVEHLMAALAACGVSDAIVRLDGPEVPIMDGSAEPFVAGLLRAGIVALDRPLEAIRILRPVAVEAEGRSAMLLPSPRPGIAVEIEFADPAIGRQRRALMLTGASAIADLADSRTFCLRAEIEAMRKAGLARGGSLENAIVVDGGRVLNPGGLRHGDEFVRHKMLDALGDLALAGAPILGLYQGRRSGHEMTNRLLRALFAAPQAFDRVELPAALALRPATGAPARPRALPEQIAV